MHGYLEISAVCSMVHNYNNVQLQTPYYIILIDSMLVWYIGTMPNAIDILCCTFAHFVTFKYIYVEL